MNRRCLAARVRPAVRNVLLPAVVLALGLTITAAATESARASEAAEARVNFVEDRDAVVTAIEVRMAAYEQVLRGAQALLAADRNTTREEWRAYVHRLELAQTHPGIQGVGLSVLIPPDALEEHVQLVRSGGFPGYNVTPPGQRDVYSAIVYLEPFEGRNLRAFGYDMYSEPVRREAMRRAAETGRPALSGLVTLVQETEVDVQPGFLLYLPVYEGEEPADAAERQARLRAWVYSPFRARDLMAGTVGDIDGMSVSVYDGPASGGGLFYQAGAEGSADGMRGVREVEVAGRTWTVVVQAEEPVPGYGPLALAVLIGGSAVSVLLAAVVLTMATTRQRAEARAAAMTADLATTEARFRAIAESANDVIINVNDRNQVVYANPALERVLGWRVEDVLGKPVASLLPEPSRAAYLGGFARIGDGASGGPPASFEVTALHKDGREVPMEVSLSTWQGPDGRYFSSILRDLTERKRAEAALLDRERQLMEAQAIANIGSWELDLQTNRFTWTPELSRILGVDPQGQQVPFEEAMSIVHEEDLQTVMEALFAAARQGRSFQLEYRVVPPDGRPRLLEVRAQPHRVDGRIVAVRGTAQDITQRREAEDARREAEESRRRIEQLEENERFRAQFLNVSAHELATPLTPIALQIHMLRRAPPEATLAQYEKGIQVIERGFQRLSRLVRDILDSARVQGERLQLRPERVDVARVVADAVDAFREPAGARGLRLVHERAPPCEAVVDAGRIQQVLDNLLTNALKFTPEGGRVTVEVRPEPDEVEVVVRDTGAGLDADQVQRLFLPFSQVHDPMQVTERGTGLGLYISRGIIEQHGGRIWVRSAGRGRGSEFGFRIPRQWRAPRPAAGGGRAPAMGTGRPAAAPGAAASGAAAPEAAAPGA
ncbi:MAG TPA: CHASE domain-containing protein, partial [Candidatus Thermoplasmatota archaeon]|nr:CHASE domain-containing protein [Candidatus Thermoplasmatota archaeon]